MKNLGNKVRKLKKKKELIDKETDKWREKVRKSEDPFESPVPNQQGLQKERAVGKKL